MGAFCLHANQFLTLRRCATSFLFTQRRAVVFSVEKSKQEEVNAIIRVLAALCTDEQLQYSTFLVPEQRFIPDMYLQGLDEMPLQDDLFECATALLRHRLLTFVQFQERERSDAHRCGREESKALHNRSF